MESIVEEHCFYRPNASADAKPIMSKQSQQNDCNVFIIIINVISTGTIFVNFYISQLSSCTELLLVCNELLLL